VTPSGIQASNGLSVPFQRDGQGRITQISTPPDAIAAKLYPDSSIQAKAFEDTPLPKDFFDAAIGNIPFGNYPVYDPAYSRSPQLTRSIHDYFLTKTMDVVRPGVVVALIISRYSMDKEDSTVRRHLAERATLLGAVRLPNTAFQANAGTEVTTDILFLQKRSAETPPGESWMELSPVATPDGPLEINEYFARHTSRTASRTCSIPRIRARAVAGNVSGSNASPRRLTIWPSRSARPPALTAPATGTCSEIACNTGPWLSRILYTAAGRSETAFPKSPGSRFPIRAGTAPYCRDSIPMRPSIISGFRTQLSDAPDEAIVEARRLNRTYDSFTSHFGPLNRRENARAFAGDPDQPLLLSLENFDPETRRAAKTAIFDRRTLERYRPVERVETAAEALLVSLNETGEIRWPRMESLTGRSAFELQDELGSLVYLRARSPNSAPARRMCLFFGRPRNSPRAPQIQCVTPVS
jgi:hypothetical protein